jgi:hypothetical protein
MDAVAEVVLPQTLPSIFDRVEFGREWRQMQQADVLREFQLSSGAGACRRDRLSVWRVRLASPAC